LKFITSGIADKIDSFLEDYFAKSGGEFFCGDRLTGADIMIHFCLEGATQQVPLSETSFPKLYKYMRGMQQRDAYKRAAERVSKESGEDFVAFSDLKM
jgi:glutathione S-transferase